MIRRDGDALGVDAPSELGFALDVDDALAPDPDDRGDGVREVVKIQHRVVHAMCREPAEDSLNERNTGDGERRSDGVTPQRSAPRRFTRRAGWRARRARLPGRAET